MLVAAFAILVLVTPASPLSNASGAGRPHAAHAERHLRPQRPERLVHAGVLAGDLYSARAKRRIASFLRMRLLELRLRSLKRAAAVVEHRLSLEELLRAP